MISDVVVAADTATAAVGTSGSITLVGSVQLAINATRQPGELVDAGQALTQISDRVVLSAVAFKSGHLRFNVDPGIMINVPPDLNRTRWSATTDKGRVISSAPGGGITVKQPSG